MLPDRAGRRAERWRQLGRKLRLIVRVALISACALFGFWTLAGLPVFSFQAGGWAGLAARRHQYEGARLGQLLALAAFVASRAQAGAVLRGTVFSPGARRENQVKSVLQFTVGFTAVAAVLGSLILCGAADVVPV